jgi:predicted DNA-binding protein with PD1-like motif
VHVIEVAEGELLEGIEAAAKAAGITDAVIVSLIGTADDFTISTPPLNDATRDQPLSYAMPAEMTGTGEITGGKPHLHVVMAVQGSKALAGHLVRAEIRTRSVRVYLLPVQ